MKHLILCREYPPAPGGGIGAYVFHISRLLAESGETVHVIAQAWKGSEPGVETVCGGHLIVHRLPFEDWNAVFPPKPHPLVRESKELALFHSGFHPQCFSWQAGLLAEKLVEAEGIDLIEAQEYEAPLYYLLIRRALGLGPKRQPPAFVHLHSPTEFIAQHNNWSQDSTWVQTAKRLEDYCINSADALLSPSQSLARQAQVHYSSGLPDIHVIPLPLGDIQYIPRLAQVWKSGRICYLGRLERRKGILEWLEAAVIIARQSEDIEFEFVGSNILGNNRIHSQAIVNELVPPDLRSRFHFRGNQPRAAVLEILRQSRLVVVPSRWENFPYSCIEAMGTGLPVLATQNGGMVEMIDDGRSGWLTTAPGVDGLVDGMTRALAVSPEELAEKGRHASATISRLCNNQDVLSRHLEFRRKLALQAPSRSTDIPAILPFGEPFVGKSRVLHSAEKIDQKGIALVISPVESMRLLRDTLQSIASQKVKPVWITLCTLASSRKIQELLNEFKDIDQLVRISLSGSTDLFTAGWQEIAASGLDPLGVIYLNAGQNLAPECLEICESILRDCPRVAMVSYWYQLSGRKQEVYTSLCPGFPYQRRANEVVSAAAIRIEALQQAIHQRPVVQSGLEFWELANSIMACGWAAVCVPKVLLVEERRKRPQFHKRNISNSDDPWTQSFSLRLVLRYPILTAKTFLAIIFQSSSR